LTIIVLAESIDFTTCEGAHISKMLTIHVAQRALAIVHTITRLILAAEKLTFDYYVKKRYKKKSISK